MTGQPIRPHAIDQRLRRSVPVDMHEHLPTIFRRIRQLSIEQFEVDSRIARISFFLAMGRDRHRNLQPRRAPLGRAIQC